jgi:hypothetical protein
MRDGFARDCAHRQFNNLRWAILTAIRVNAVLQTNCKPQFLFWIELSMNTSGPRLHQERDVRSATSFHTRETLQGWQLSR